MLKSIFLFGKGELFVVSLQCKTKDNTNKKATDRDRSDERLFNTKN